jgi:hypothetical protein
MEDSETQQLRAVALSKLQEAYAEGQELGIWQNILTVWTASYDTGEHFSQDAWLDMFGIARQRFKPPVKDSYVLYRGTVAGHERRMAWTTCPKVARWFAAYSIHTIWPGTEVGNIYRTTAPKTAVLCERDRNPSPGRMDEHEVIVDPRLLDEIEKVDEITQGTVVHHPRVVGCSYVGCTCIGGPFVARPATLPEN